MVSVIISKMSTELNNGVYCSKTYKKVSRHPIKNENLKNSMILAMEMCKHDITIEM